MTARVTARNLNFMEDSRQVSLCRGGPTRSQRRRLKRLAAFALRALQAKNPAKAYAPISWLFLAGLVWLFIHAGQNPGVLAASVGLFLGLVAIAVIDAQYFIILDQILVFLLAVGATFVAVCIPTELLDRILTAVAAYVGVRLLAWGYERLRGEPGIGMGDAKLLAVGAVWIGSDGLPSCLILAVISALLSVFLQLRMLAPLNPRSAVPFGPHLAIAIWLVWSFGPIALG
jgi:leader peptidase (prepilin peptidase)/N-methyltransferase